MRSTPEGAELLRCRLRLKEKATHPKLRLSAPTGSEDQLASLKRKGLSIQKSSDKRSTQLDQVFDRDSATNDFLTKDQIPIFKSSHLKSDDGKRLSILPLFVLNYFNTSRTVR